ncbi:thermonuclease family protein [Planctomycetota bacterium]|nr:thermonuclease family protein [Planctomycetota bacterium]
MKIVPIIGLAFLLAGCSIGFGLGMGPIGVGVSVPVDSDRYEEPETFLVDRVVGGDSVILEDGQKVRLLCIDTPEMRDEGYFEASAALRAMCEGRHVELIPDPEHDDKDRYGRLLRYLLVDGVIINIRMIELGHSEYETRWGESDLFADRFEAADTR